MDLEEEDKTPPVANPEPAVDAVSPVADTVATAGDVPPPSAPPPPRPREPRVPLPSSLQEIVGALLFASESPLTAGELRNTVRGVAPDEGDDAELMDVYKTCTSREIDQALHGLEKELERSGCGFRLVCSGGAYRLQTTPTCGRYVRALLKLDRPNRLSRASLETLAIVAYRQPITKAEIEQIRGVGVDTIMKSLVELQLVRLVGRSELPGHPFLYGTTPLFLEHFGLASLSELNALDPTLQRSNPRERAKLFVKKEKPADETPAESADASESVDESAPATDSVVETSDAAVESAPDDAEAQVAAASGEVVSAGLSGGSDDDDVFIDDTPEEFDEDDDEDADDDVEDEDSDTDDDDDFDDDEDDEDDDDLDDDGEGDEEDEDA